MQDQQQQADPRVEHIKSLFLPHDPQQTGAIPVRYNPLTSTRGREPPADLVCARANFFALAFVLFVGHRFCSSVAAVWLHIQPQVDPQHAGPR